MNENILIVEDDAFLRDGLCEIFNKENYIATAVSNVKRALNTVGTKKFNLIVLDVLLPDGNGFDLCAEIRKTDNTTPILFLTACDEELHIVRGLDSGADDYVTKPFKLLELLSRVRALLRRNSNALFKSKDIVIDTHLMTVRKNGESIFVTKTEFQILSMLMRNGGIIVTRETLLQNIWDDNNNFIDDNTLSVHISRLREKIGAQHIVTIRGVGYRWEE